MINLVTSSALQCRTCHQIYYWKLSLYWCWWFVCSHGSFLFPSMTALQWGPPTMVSGGQMLCGLCKYHFLPTGLNQTPSNRTCTHNQVIFLVTPVVGYNPWWYWCIACPLYITTMPCHDIKILATWHCFLYWPFMRIWPQMRKAFPGHNALMCTEFPAYLFLNAQLWWSIKCEDFHHSFYSYRYRRTSL